MAVIEGRFFTGSMTDKRHEADGLAEYLRHIIGSGVLSLGTNLQVSISGMNAVVNYGDAIIAGYLFRVRDNGSGTLSLPVSPTTIGTRKDRVVVRKDSSTNEVKIYIKQGTSSTAPALLDTSTVKEISLALITAGTASMSLTTDERSLVTAALQSYPIGSIYLSVNNVNPGTVFGGTWAAWGTGRVPVAVDTGDTDFNTVEKTGGAKTHSHGMTSAYGKIRMASVASGSLMMRRKTTEAWTANLQNSTAITMGFSSDEQNTGLELGGSTDSALNSQPYITCYMWKRTA